MRMQRVCQACFVDYASFVGHPEPIQGHVDGNLGLWRRGPRLAECDFGLGDAARRLKPTGDSQPLT